MAEMMQWSKLISDKRFGLEQYHNPAPGTRSDFQRDYDRLVFSSPFRRLQNKTQVFPLPGSIFVHNRLTHSMEVSCVGRSLANEVSNALQKKYAAEPWCNKLNDLGDIVAAACLAHDLGNPPFGHSGEKAISTFFSEGEGAVLRDEFSDEEWDDLIHFEGNANSLRLLIHQFKGRRPGGFAMTYSMLASIVKYPYESTLAGNANKFGFFITEKDDFVRIANELGILPRYGANGEVAFVRHPLVYIVEAADDICYEVMDIEDAHKLKILNTQEVTNLLMGFFDEERKTHMLNVMENVADPNEKVAYMRSCVIGRLVSRCAEAFVANEEAILGGQFKGSLIDHIPQLERDGYICCTEMSWDKIYKASDVVDIELAGNQIITYLLGKFIYAVTHPQLNYSKLLLSKVPQQYDINAPTLYERIQGVIDHVSGMTDVYALDLYRNLNGMSLPAV